MLRLITRTFLLLLTILIFIPNCLSVFAHPYSTTYTNINITEEKITFEFQIDSTSVLESVPVDTNKNNKLDKREVKEHEEKIAHLFEDKSEVLLKGELAYGEHISTKLTTKEDKEVVKVVFEYPGATVGETVGFTDHLYWNDENSRYVNFLNINYNNEMNQVVLEGQNREWLMLLTEEQVSQEQIQQTTEEQEQKNVDTFQSFFNLGIHHILTGYDHLLFLLALLIRRQSLKESAIIITAFTIAHSITIALGVLDVVSIPSKLVEVIIALSICYIAIENLFVKTNKYRWLITFIFGLIHGLGFAGLLSETDIPNRKMAISLLGFNSGIEVMQLILVFVALPVISLLRNKLNEKKFTVILSVTISLFGLYWLIERILG